MRSPSSAPTWKPSNVIAGESHNPSTGWGGRPRNRQDSQQEINKTGTEAEFERTVDFGVMSPQKNGREIPWSVYGLRHVITTVPPSIPPPPPPRACGPYSILLHLGVAFLQGNAGPERRPRRNDRFHSRLSRQRQLRVGEVPGVHVSTAGRKHTKRTTYWYRSTVQDSAGQYLVLTYCRRFSGQITRHAMRRLNTTHARHFYENTHHTVTTYQLLVRKSTRTQRYTRMLHGVGGGRWFFVFRHTYLSLPAFSATTASIKRVQTRSGYSKESKQKHAALVSILLLYVDHHRRCPPRAVAIPGGSTGVIPLLWDACLGGEGGGSCPGMLGYVATIINNNKQQRCCTKIVHIIVLYSS